MKPFPSPMVVIDKEHQKYMCGIFAYTGTKNNALPILVDGLKTLEYRGYDSAGVFTPETGGIKAVGAVVNLMSKTKEGEYAKSGIAHTRWATHGKPSKNNSHPHCNGDETIWVTHNGIIENYKELKENLVSLGYKFKSETDSEVLPHLISKHFKTTGDIKKAIINTLKEVKGTYGLAIIHKDEPEKIIVSRLGSPLVIGIGKGENFVASDSTPILKHTKDVVYLDDGEIAIITPDSYNIFSLNGEVIDKKTETLSWSTEENKKDGYEHFMMKEIMEGPDVVKNTIRGRTIPNEGLAKLGGLDDVSEKLRKIDRLIIVGCGTAYYSSLVGEYMLEEYAGIPVEVELGSEFRYRNPVIDEHTALLTVSQSGETADTLEAIKEAKRKGALTLGIVNVVGSTIARETDAGIYNHAGPEVSVASTKAFISQLSALALLTVFLGRQRGMSASTGEEIINELSKLPKKIDEILKQKGKIEKIAKKYSQYKDFLYMGRKYNFPIAYEGALKIKEVSYVHAEGCGAGEIKHGSLAMIDENFPTVAIVPKDSVYEKTVSNIQEIRARSGPVLAISNEGCKEIDDLANDVIKIPQTIEMLSPILTVIPLQLLAYYFATHKGLDVDRPRNLAKSVTVE